MHAWEFYYLHGTKTPELRHNSRGGGKKVSKGGGVAGCLLINSRVKFQERVINKSAFPDKVGGLQQALWNGEWPGGRARLLIYILN